MRAIQQVQEAQAVYQRQRLEAQQKKAIGHTGSDARAPPKLAAWQ
jgi:hypothetical protein